MASSRRRNWNQAGRSTRFRGSKGQDPAEDPAQQVQLPGLLLGDAPDQDTKPHAGAAKGQIPEAGEPVGFQTDPDAPKLGRRHRDQQERSPFQYFPHPGQFLFRIGKVEQGIKGQGTGSIGVHDAHRQGSCQQAFAQIDIKDGQKEHRRRQQQVPAERRVPARQRQRFVLPGDLDQKHLPSRCQGQDTGQPQPFQGQQRVQEHLDPGQGEAQKDKDQPSQEQAFAKGQEKSGKKPLPAIRVIAEKESQGSRQSRSAAKTHE